MKKKKWQVNLVRPLGKGVFFITNFFIFRFCVTTYTYAFLKTK